MKLWGKKYSRGGIIAVGIIIALCAGWCLYRYIDINLWIHTNPPELQAFPQKLITDRQTYSIPDQQDPDISAIESVLIREITKDRIVLNLSRSDVIFTPFRRKAYVKVYLETAVPEKNNNKKVRVKLLEVLSRKGNTWHLISTGNLLIQ